MGADSKIEWCDATFNPWIGCARVSAGCLHCYAETLMDTRYGRVEWGVNGTRVRTSVANWRKPHAWNRAAEKAGRRDRVFCSSLADVFEDRPELVGWRADLFEVIHMTPNLDWLLLTKRPENVLRLIPAWYRVATEALGPNVWIGTSVEDQATAHERIPHLLDIPAAVRFLSIEPLLGPVDLSASAGRLVRYKLNWVIVGGESGPKARPMHVQWARDIRDECTLRGVPFLFKQWGEFGSDGNRVGKHAAGRLIDGREWNEFPEATS